MSAREAAVSQHKAELEEAQRTVRDLRGEVEQAKLNEAKAAQELKGILFLLFQT
jgi:multidrug resistance efflux pump